MKSAKVQPFCRWTEDDEGNWDTDCGEKYVLITGTPRENRISVTATATASGAATARGVAEEESS
jgi:hypothetical protein